MYIHDLRRGLIQNADYLGKGAVAAVDLTAKQAQQHITALQISIKAFEDLAAITSSSSSLHYFLERDMPEAEREFYKQAKHSLRILQALFPTAS